MVFKDYYKILGLDSNKVTEDEIKTAYREQAKKYHPDMNVGNTDYEEVFKDINEAYRILSNDRTKRKYDFQWKRYSGKESKTTTKDEKKSLKDNLIGIFLGEENAPAKKEKVRVAPKYGEDITTRIDVSIEEAMAANCQLIVRKSATFSEFVKNEKTAYVAEYSETLTSLCLDYLNGQIKPTTEEAYNLISNYNLENFGQNLMKVYESLVTNQK